MKTNTCPNCGEKILGGKAFCANCGFRLPEETEDNKVNKEKKSFLVKLKKCFSTVGSTLKGIPTFFKKNKRKTIKIGIITGVSALVITAVVLCSIFVFPYLPHYISGNNALGEGRYEEALKEFDLANGLFNSEEKIKETHYEYGKDLLDKDKYEDAIEQFEQVGDYADSSEKIQQSYFECAEDLYEKKHYYEAYKIFKDCSGIEETKTKIDECLVALVDSEKYYDAANIYDDKGEKGNAAYYSGLGCLKEKKYSQAIEFFGKASGVKEAEQKIKEAYYCWGVEVIDNDSSTAKSYFKKAGDYEGASNMIYACDLLAAEKDYKAGKLNDAYSTFKQLPKGFVYKDISVDSRISTLDKAKSIMNAIGEWSVTSNYIESKEIWNYDGRWENWYNDETIPGQVLKISAKPNSKGTFDLEGSVSFYRFTNFSSLQSLCQATSTTEYFTIENVTSIPSSKDISSNTTLKYSGGTFSIKYYVKEYYSTNFTHVYSSSVTFGKKTG